MGLKEMPEEFFDWLNDCPVSWTLNREESESLEYCFICPEEEEEEPEEDSEEEKI